MASMRKVAIVTGGASGMGFAVSEALTSRGDWNVHIFDMNKDAGIEAAKKLGATFHQVNVADYNSLGAAFKIVFTSSRRLDFVHANAGIMEKGNFYAVHETKDEPPPPIPSIVVDIDVMSVIHTSYLAQHYFRQTPNDGFGPRSLVITASCGGFYKVPASPVYAAAKHAMIGWTRSIAGRMWRDDGIRVNAICPGTVRTNLLTPEQWQTFPKEYFIPIEKIVEVVLMLLDTSKKEANGAEGEKPMIGQTVEISGTQHYFRSQYDYCDGAMAAVMASIIEYEPYSVTNIIGMIAL